MSSSRIRPHRRARAPPPPPVSRVAAGTTSSGARARVPATASASRREAAAAADDRLSSSTGLLPQLPADEQLREVSRHAIWSVSSAKANCGVDCLIDNRLDTYWQSDGSQPHLVNVQFLQRTAVKYVYIYCDAKQDESYTPSKVSVRSGNYHLDLEEIEQVEFGEPQGWMKIELEDEYWGAPHRCFMLQIAVLANHQNGRDTHVRQIRIYSPKPSAQIDADAIEDDEIALNPNMPQFGPDPQELPANEWSLK